MKGFTLIEVLISLSIFLYVFSSLMILFFQFSKGVHGNEKCSSFSFVLIQGVLTENENIQVSSTNDGVVFDNQTLQAEAGALYLFKNSEKDEFVKNKTNFQLDSCDVSFSKNLTTTTPLINVSKCIDFQYKHGSPQTICALK